MKSKRGLLLVSVGFLLIPIGFFIGPSHANAQTASSITVTSPNGGEEWISGQTYRITWQATEVDFVQIYISDDSIFGSGSTNYVVPNNGTIQANLGYYDWVIPDIKQLPGGVGSNYKIRVQDRADDSIIDKSDNYFSIVSNYPGFWMEVDKESYNISDASKDSVILTMRRADGRRDLYPVDLFAIPPGRDQFAKVLLEGNMMVGYNTIHKIDLTKHPVFAQDYGIYLLLVCHVDGCNLGGPAGTSNGIWISLEKASVISPSITVLSPSGGEAWEIGKTYEVSWKISGSADLISGVAIYLENHGTSPWEIFTATLNAPALTGSYMLTVPADGTLSTGEKYMVAVTPVVTAGSSSTDRSDGFLAVVSPNSTTPYLPLSIFTDSFQPTEINVVPGDKDVQIMKFNVQNHNLIDNVAIQKFTFMLQGINGTNLPFSLVYWYKGSGPWTFSSQKLRPTVTYNASDNSTSLVFAQAPAYSLGSDRGSTMPMALILETVPVDAVGLSFQASFNSLEGYNYNFNDRRTLLQFTGEAKGSLVLIAFEETEAVEFVCLEDGTLIKSPNDPRIYVIKDCKKQWIRTGEEFQEEGYKWEEVREAANESLIDAYADYLITQAKLLRALNDNKVYRIIGNKKLWVPTAESFAAQSLDWNDVQETASAEVEAYPTARLLRTKGDPRVYFITDNGFKKWIRTAAIFNSYSTNRWDDIVEVEENVINSFDEVNLMRLHGGTKVYKIESDERKWIKTAEAFNKYLFDWKRIVAVNELELSAYVEGETIE